jgi:hypothetical protein
LGYEQCSAFGAWDVTEQKQSHRREHEAGTRELSVDGRALPFSVRVRTEELAGATPPTELTEEAAG